MSGPRPVEVSEAGVEMVSIDGMEWTTNDRYGHDTRGGDEKLPKGWERRFSAEDDEWYYTKDSSVSCGHI